MPITKSEQTERLRRNEEKWTPTLMNAGWTVIPSILLEKQAALGLDAIDVNILLHLAKHWWYRENPPHPSKISIAKAMGIDASTVRKRIARMQSEGFIQREYRYKKLGGQETNFYHFEGLIKALTPHAEEFIALREKQREEHEARKRRKKPKPTLVVDNTVAVAAAGG
jgi:predicted transcriptional regulator